MPKLLKAEQCGLPPLPSAVPLYSIVPCTPVHGTPVRCAPPAEGKAAAGADAAPAAGDPVCRAREQAGRILENARRESRRAFEQCRADGYRAGYDEGLEAGREEGKKQGRDAAFASVCEQERERIRQATALAGEFARAQEEFLEALRCQSVEFAFEIVRKILHREAAQSPESMEPMILDLLGEIRDENPVVLTVSRDMRERLLKCETFMAALAAMPAQMELRAGAEMENGDCLIDTPDFTVDAGIFSQTERLKEAFL